MADINFGILDTQMPGRIAAIPQQQQAQQAQNAMQLMQVQQSMNQNELARYQLSAAKRADEETNKLRTVYGEASDITSDDFRRKVYAINYEKGIALDKAIADRAKSGLDVKNLTSQISERDLKVQQLRLEHAYESFSRLAAMPGGATNEAIDAAVADAVKNQGLGMQQGTQLSDQLKNLPLDKRAQVLGSLALKAEKRLELFAPKPTAVTTPSGGVSFVDTSGLSPTAGQTPAGFTNFAPGMTQYQTGQLGVSRGNLALRNRELDPYNMLSPIPTGGGGGVPRVNNLGTTTPVPAPAPAPAPQASQAPAGVASKMTLADAFKNNVTGPEFISLIPPQVKPVVESILRYDQRPPSTATKQGLRLLELVNQADPTYDAGKAQTRYIAKQTFVKGPVADAIASTNTAIDHMDTLAKYGADLNNTDVRLANAAKQKIAAAFGADAPTTFDATRRIVGQEVVKAVVANGGSMREREEAADAFNRANSPAQLAGVIKSYQALLGGRLKSTQLRYENDTGLKDFQAKLLPATIRAISGAEATPAGAALTPADQQALDWAAANPNDPRAAKIRQKNGVK